MARRSSQEWQTIIEQQEASNLTVVDFCEQQNVNRRYFYARRHILRKLQQGQQTASFVKVSKTPMISATMPLHVSDARLILPLDCEPLWLAQLLKAISSWRCLLSPRIFICILRPWTFANPSMGWLWWLCMQLELSPLSDALFIFSNKKRDKLKILYWDKTGFALWYKRLEKQRFKWPSHAEDTSLSLSEQQLHWLLGGSIS